MKRRVMWIALAVVAAVSLLAWMLLSGRGPAPPRGELTPAHEAPTPTPACQLLVGDHQGKIWGAGLGPGERFIVG